ncbi:isoamylase early set domain-containing protein [Desulfovibrio sp. OttesenSCG-928-O18]|nr:isoamylase early set domain-containing protein [Desulfovibrio sp. OttesenSCG-928-O18]
MSIAKQFLKSKPECKVKFMLTDEECGHAESVALVGDFNSWNPAANPMKKQKGGGFATTLTLPSGATNKFRYLADGKRWINDPAADGYEYCAFADGENSILCL